MDFQWLLEHSQRDISGNSWGQRQCEHNIVLLLRLFMWDYVNTQQTELNWDLRRKKCCTHVWYHTAFREIKCGNYVYVWTIINHENLFALWFCTENLQELFSNFIFGWFISFLKSTHLMHATIWLVSLDINSQTVHHSHWQRQ